jgi:gamma-glutamylcyclotransferase (GGCT)/AIG2-like uncharacterized protein YtfP
MRGEVMAVDEVRPFFVYGTLRRGQRNHRLLAGTTLRESPALLAGHALVDLGVPYAVEAEPASTVVGELMEVHPARYAGILAALDRLEGYRPRNPWRSHYLRAVRTVRLPGPAGQIGEVGDAGDADEVEAWVYLVGHAVLPRLASAARVPGGDWVATRGWAA